MTSLYVLLLLPFIFVFQLVSAQNWTGNVDSNWNNSANWSDWPLDGEDIVIDPLFYTGAMAQPNVNNNSVFSPAEVLIQNGGVLTIDANLSTEDDVEVLGEGSAINMNSGTFEVNFLDGGRLIFEMGSSLTMEGGTLSVGERFIVGQDALVTINDGAANSLERWLMDSGGKCIQNGGTVTAGQVFAMGDGSIENDSGYELHGGALNISGEMAFENELGVFEPTFLMTGGELSVTGDVVWFGEGLGGGTPRFIMNGGTALVFGSVLNSPFSTVSMFLHFDGDAAFNMSNGFIDQTTVNDSIVQSGNSQVTLEDVSTVNIVGTYYATGGDAIVTATTTTILIGSGTVQFNNLLIGTGGSLFHQTPSTIKIFGNLDAFGLFVPMMNAVEFNGSVPQEIQSGGSITFQDLVSNNSSSEGLTLLSPVEVDGHLQLNDGMINTSDINTLTILDDATSNMGGSETFVNGPMTKIGDDAYVFPLGQTDRWARLSISAPSNSSSEITAQYFNSSYTSTIPVNAPLNSVSENEYWSLETNSPGEEVLISLFWEDPVFSDIDCGNVTMTRWNDAAWVHVPSNSTGDCLAGEGGSVISQSAISDFGILTFGYFAPVGLGEENEIAFDIFPNPTAGNMTISLEKVMSGVTVQLINLCGKRVLSKPFNGTQQMNIDLSDQPAGIYLLQLVSDNNVSSRKVVKR